LFDEFEESNILDTCHFDDFSDAVADPAFVQSAPKAATGQCKYWRMVRALEVLETVAVAAGARRWPCVDACDNGCS